MSDKTFRQEIDSILKEAAMSKEEDRYEEYMNGKRSLQAPATCPDCGELVSKSGYCSCIQKRLSEGDITLLERTPTDIQRYSIKVVEKHCPNCNGTGILAYCDLCSGTGEKPPTREDFRYMEGLGKQSTGEGFVENLDLQPEQPTQMPLICLFTLAQQQAHDSEVAKQAVKEFAEKVIATMPINNQVKKQRVLMIAHIRAMAEGKE